MKINESFLKEVVEQMVSNKHVIGAVLCVENGQNTLSWLGNAGNIKKDDCYFITSVTKLVTTAVVLQLRAENRLHLTDKVSKYLPGELTGLHILNGVDHTKDITVTHLLANTSGIPDYLSYKQENGKTADYNLFNQGKDQGFSFEETLEMARTLNPAFPPGQKGKVLYSNTNYRLLGAIIERITGKDIATVFEEFIFAKINLSNTYVFQDIGDDKPIPMRLRASDLHLPKCMASVTTEGGLISTAADVMVILKAFFNGTFFPQGELNQLKHWNFIFFPLQSYFGVGLEKLWVPRIFSPLKPIGEVMGFWGSSGAFAFHNPATDLYFSGTVNQASGLGHKAAFNAMIKIIKAAG